MSSNKESASTNLCTPNLRVSTYVVALLCILLCPCIILLAIFSYIDLGIFIVVPILFSKYGTEIGSRMISQKCPNCHSLGAMEVIHRTITDEQSIAVKKVLETKNFKDEVIGTTETYVPGMRQCSDDIDECKYCHYQRSLSRTQEYELTH